MALLNIRLPDMKGTKLLTAMQKNFPEMVKTMITGLPPDSAEEFLNLGADASLIKSIHPEELLNIIKEKLREQEEVTIMDV